MLSGIVRSKSSEKSNVNASISGRIVALDALRGFAALYIFVYHLMLVPKPHLVLPDWLYSMVKYGWSGVTLFFILSGFTLYHSMSIPNVNHNTLIFYIRRLSRIVPLYYVWLTIMIVHEWGWFGFLNHKLELFLYLSFSYNLIPAYQTGLVWASWFLGVQMLFYLIFPFLFSIVNTTRRALIFLGISMIAANAYASFISHFFAEHPEKAMIIYFGFFYQLPVFALGILAYFVFKRLSTCSQSSRLWGPVFLGSAIIGWLLIVFFDIIGLSSLYKIMVVAFTYGFSMLGLILFPTSFLVNKFSKFFGKISYSLYLNHPGVILLFCPIYRLVYSLDYAPWNSFGICMVATLLVVTAMSYLTNRLVEEPGNYLGSLLVGWFQRRKVEGIS
jgi:peptidoglycan/LPS O-acetylase OafA/YrhL